MRRLFLWLTCSGRGLKHGAMVLGHQGRRKPKSLLQLQHPAFLKTKTRRSSVGWSLSRLSFSHDRRDGSQPTLGRRCVWGCAPVLLPTAVFYPVFGCAPSLRSPIMPYQPPRRACLNTPCCSSGGWSLSRLSFSTDRRDGSQPALGRRYLQANAPSKCTAS